MELKELYIAPEAERIGFLPIERLAFDITLEGGNNDGDGSVIFGNEENPDNGEA